MSKSLTVLFVAYATGILCVGWLIHLVKRLPMHVYVKVVLIVIMPIPPACIGWVVTYYGPSPGDMETIELSHCLAMAEPICEGLGAGALSVVVFVGARLAGAKLRERRERQSDLSKEAIETLKTWRGPKERHRPTARELREGGEPKEEKRKRRKTYFGHAP